MKKAKIKNGDITIIDWEDQKYWIPEEEQSQWLEFIPANTPEEYDASIQRVKVSYVESEGKIYEKRNLITDGDKVRKKIQDLKVTLSESDYKVIKMYEAVLTYTESPYNTEEVIAERQAIRDQINELEALIS